MSSDYHDVPHCIRQALAASPAPTHYSRISESPSHDEVMIAQTLSPAGVVGDFTSTTAPAAAESQTAAASSFQGFGQTVLGEGPEFFTGDFVKCRTLMVLLHGRSKKCGD